MNFEDFYSEYLKISNYSVNLDNNFRCPLQCSACIRQTGPLKQLIKRSSDISTASYMKLIKHFHRINFCGQISDPIYHPNFLKQLEINSRCRNRTFIYHTTATRKPIVWWKKAFELTNNINHEWCFGLDGFTQEIAEKYRVNTKCEEVKEVITLASKYKFLTIWQFIVFNHNIQEIEKVHEFCRDKKIRLLIIGSNRNSKKLKNVSVPSEYNNEKKAISAKTKYFYDGRLNVV